MGGGADHRVNLGGDDGVNSAAGMWYPLRRISKSYGVTDGVAAMIGRSVSQRTFAAAVAIALLVAAFLISPPPPRARSV